jgi:hypothetical protein
VVKLPAEKGPNGTLGAPLTPVALSVALPVYAAEFSEAVFALTVTVNGTVAAWSAKGLKMK